METLHKILVPVDFGELSEAALRRAIDLAKAVGATVTVLHVHEYSLWSVDGTPGSTIDAAMRVRDKADRALDALLERYRTSGVEIRGLLREGAPWSETINCARECGADLILVGTRNRSRLSRALMGSVAEKIVRHSPIPVLTFHTPPPAGDEPAHEASPAPGPTGATGTAAPVAPHAAPHHDEEILALSGAV